MAGRCVGAGSCMVSREMLRGRSSLSTTPLRKRIHSGSSASHLGGGSGGSGSGTRTNSGSVSSGRSSTRLILGLFVFVLVKARLTWIG